MTDAVDQIFVSLKQFLVGLAPEEARSLVSMLLSIAAILGTFLSLFAFTVLLERKGLGRMQNRPGPNRVGPFGLLQPLADFVKMLTKEDLVPAGADPLVHLLAPVTLLVAVLLAYAVLPVGRNMAAVDLDAGVLFFFAAGAWIEIAIFMAGWSSRSKYPLLGAMRAIAQMISYELPLMLATVPALMIAGSLSLPGIVDAQSGYSAGWLARWHVFTPWGLAGFVLFMIAATAESNRAPFDLPEGESEIIAGHLVEYSGFKYALFFMGEYLGMFAASALGITLFLGGWRSPVSFLAWVPSYVWFFAKLFACIAALVWLRGTLPRVRMNQLMNFAWKLMLPLTVFNLLATAIWHYTAGWAFTGAGLTRWLACAAVVFIPYLWLGKTLFGGQHWGPRTYRYAT